MFEIRQDHNGYTVIYDIPAWGNAGEILKERGIDWENAITLPIVNHGQYYYNSKPTTSIHVHFMNKNGDEVGYYTHFFNSLLIFDIPRGWGNVSKNKAVSEYSV